MSESGMKNKEALSFHKCQSSTTTSDTPLFKQRAYPPDLENRYFQLSPIFPKSFYFLSCFYLPSLDLYSVLKKNSGRCQNQELALDLSCSDQKNGHSSETVGILNVRLDGLAVDLLSLPAARCLTNL